MSAPAVIAIEWPRKYPLAGIGVSAVEMPEALDVVFRAARQRSPSIVGHLAVNNLIHAIALPEFGRVINAFNLVTTDGQPIRLSLNFLRHTALRTRVTAREMMLAICARAEHEALAVYLYGDEALTQESLRRKLLQRFPRLRIVGGEASLFRPLTGAESDGLVDRLNASGAHFVFVALGCPLQEQFAFDHRNRVDAVQLCVGAAFKMLAGERSVAPQWMQALCLEWLYRCLQDPRRLFWRYARTNTIFLSMAAAAVAARGAKKVAAVWARLRYGGTA
jgi:exopolysaccharide biosynthesis WecB/TagA/CpsF family protein